MTDESAWPPGRGEMAGKVRSFDWSTTPLGPISSWRPELRTAAAFVLDTAFPAALVWGDARVTLYNDAFVPILGDKPEALGRSFAEIWSEAWSEIGGFVDRAFAGQATYIDDFPLVLRRGGEPEQAYFTFCYSPIRAGDGSVLGMIDTVVETTEGVRDRAALRENEVHLAADLAGMRRLYELHARLATETGLRVALREIVAAACEIVRTDRGCIQLVSADGERLEMVETRGFEPDSPFIQHFLREGAPVCDTLRSDRRFLIENMEDFEPLRGSRDLEIALAEDVRAAASTPMISRNGELQGVLSNQFRAPHVPSQDELRLIDLLAWTAAVTLCRSTNPAALRTSDERQRFLLDLSDALRPLSDPAVIQGTAARLIGEHLGASRAYYGEVEADGDTLVIRQDYTKGVPSVVGRYSMSDYVATQKDWLLAGQTIVMPDTAADPELDAIRREAHCAIQMRALIAVPLIKKGCHVGTFAVVQSEPRAWTAEEVALVEDAGERIWAAGEQARAEAALRESEERLRSLVTGIPQLVFRSQGNGYRIWNSQQWTDYTGLCLDSSLGFGWIEALHDEDRPATCEAWQDAQSAGEYYVEHRLRHGASGEYRWHQTRATPLPLQDGGIVEWVGTSTDVEELRQLQRHQQTLLAELQHRVRNTLGVIRSIARRTAERSTSVDEMSSHFQGRLDAFSRVQAVVTRNPEAGVDLVSLIEDELLAHAAREGETLTIDGPEVSLSPRAAESISLAIHELATNAVKYGALTGENGRVAVRWERIASDGKERLRLVWEENGVDLPPGPPERQGFGLELLQRSLPYDLRAETNIEFRREGVRFEMIVPLGPEVLAD